MEISFAFGHEALFTFMVLIISAKLFSAILSRLLSHRPALATANVSNPLVATFTDCAGSDSAVSTVHSKQKNTLDSIFIHIFNGIYLAMLEASDADKIAQHKLHCKRIIVPLFSRSPNPATPYFTPSSLADIFKFDEMMRAVQRHSPSHCIVLCASVDPFVQAKAIFLAGCHMMMTQGFSYAETVAAFAKPRAAMPRAGRIDNEGSSLECCWTALYRAKSLGWIDFGDIFDTGCDNPSRIFIEEYIHYARHA